MVRLRDGLVGKMSSGKGRLVNLGAIEESQYFQESQLTQQQTLAGPPAAAMDVESQPDLIEDSQDGMPHQASTPLSSHRMPKPRLDCLAINTLADVSSSATKCGGWSNTLLLVTMSSIGDLFETDCVFITVQAVCLICACVAGRASGQS